MAHRFAEGLLRELDLGEWFLHRADQTDKILAARTAPPKHKFCGHGNGRLSQGEFYWRHK